MASVISTGIAPKTYHSPLVHGAEPLGAELSVRQPKEAERASVSAASGELLAIRNGAGRGLPDDSLRLSSGIGRDLFITSCRQPLR